MYKKFYKIRHDSAIEEDVSVGRVLSPLPPIPSTKDASGESEERMHSKGTVASLVGPTFQLKFDSKARIMFEIKRRMILLYVCADHSCQNCLDDFAYIEFKILDYHESATQKLLENGFVEIFQHILGQFFKTAVTEADNNASNACMLAMLSACRTVINMTDVSSDACRKVIQLELHMDIINSLKSGHLYPKQTNQNLSNTLCILVEKLMSVLYNVVQMTTEAKELYREQGIIEVIQRFRTGTTNSLSCLALMFLAWVLNDEEIITLNSNDDAISFLIKQLRSSLNELFYRSDCGYEAVEMLTAINKFVLNDANKELFVKSGVLSSYVAFLELQKYFVEEQFLAAQGLWTLALKYAEEIKKEEFCVERLEMLSKKSEDDRVRSHVNGALIALGVKQENSIQASKLSSKESNS